MAEREAIEWFKREKRAFDLKRAYNFKREEAAIEQAIDDAADKTVKAKTQEIRWAQEIAKALEIVAKIPSEELRDYISKNFGPGLTNNLDVMKAAVLKDWECFYEASDELRENPVFDMYHNLASTLDLQFRTKEPRMFSSIRECVNESMKHIKDEKSLNEFKTVFYEVYQVKSKQAKDEGREAEFADAFNKVKEYVLWSPQFNAIKPEKAQVQPKEAAEKQEQQKEVTEKREQPRKRLRDRIPGLRR